MLCIINSYYIFKPFEMVPTKTTKTSSFVKFLHFKKREKKKPYSLFQCNYFFWSSNGQEKELDYF